MNFQQFIILFVKIYLLQFITINEYFREILAIGTTRSEDELISKYGEIIYTSVMFRHGDRNPYAPYPFDPYKDFEWPEGLGHLTNNGKKRLYELGKWLRRRYAKLLAEKYHYSDIIMESSDFDRTIMSGQCLLAGLYPPTDLDQWWNDDNNIENNTVPIHWQPIPVHTIPLEHDNMIALWKVCETYNRELYSANTAPKFVGLFRQYGPFFDHVGINTGIMFNENFVVLGLLKLMEIYDALNVQQRNGMELPAWSQTVFPEPMYDLVIQLFHLGTYSEKMKKIKSGPFFKSILDDMIKKVDSSSNGNVFDQCMHLYSSHDATIATIMITLEIFNGQLPPYGSALIFELRQKESEHYITVVFRNDSSYSSAHHLEIPACKSPCTLEDFVYLIKPFISEDWDDECGNNNIVQTPSPLIPLVEPSPPLYFSHSFSMFDLCQNWFIFTRNQIFVIVIVATFIITTVIYFSCKRRQEVKSKFTPLKKRE